MQIQDVSMVEDQTEDEELIIVLEHDWERRNWMKWLHCSEPELVHAVASVGPDPDNVRRFLRQAR